MDFQPQDRTYKFYGPEAIDTAALQTFPYEYPYREVELIISTDEFTSMCPFSGLPDFGSITVKYVPAQLCIELRSYKYYLISYRFVGMYYEHIVNRILEDLTHLCEPVRMTVEAEFTVRGGLKTKAIATYERDVQVENISISEPSNEQSQV